VTQWEAQADNALKPYSAQNDAERRGHFSYLFGEPLRVDLCFGQGDINSYVEIGKYGLGMFPGAGSLATRPTGGEAWMRMFDLLQFKAGGYRIDGFQVSAVDFGPGGTGQQVAGRIPCGAK